MKARIWTIEQLATLRARYPGEPTAQLVDAIGHNLRAIYAKAAELQIKKTPEYLATPASGRTCGRQGIGTRFEHGNPAWNKGMKGLDIAGERGRATQFKPGTRPHNWQPIGYERTTPDGIRQRKISDTGVTRSDWVPLHVMLWEKYNGPIPGNHIVIFKDKDRSNLSIENLECMSRAELMRRNSYHTNYPKEVAQLIQLKCALKRKLNNRSNTNANITE